MFILRMRSKRDEESGKEKAVSILLQLFWELLVPLSSRIIEHFIFRMTIYT